MFRQRGAPQQPPVRVAVYSSRDYDIKYLNAHGGDEETEIKFSFFPESLNAKTAIFAQEHDVVCLFVNDECNSEVIEKLQSYGVRLICLRCAGFNNVDLSAAHRFGVAVTRVPAYSPESVAEHALALLMTVVRKTHMSYMRCKEGDFTLNQHLCGVQLHGRTAAIIGTGMIGRCMVRICKGLGMRVLMYDVFQDPELLQYGRYVDNLDDIYRQADVISLHCPLLPTTYHIINYASVSKMKPGVFLINTSRGKLVSTPAVIEGLKTRRIAGFGLDVYENEEAMFFQYLPDQVLHDDVFERLLMLPNVVASSHMAFFTKEALSAISNSVVVSIAQAANGHTLKNEVRMKETPVPTPKAKL